MTFNNISNCQHGLLVIGSVYWVSIYFFHQFSLLKTNQCTLCALIARGYSLKPVRGSRRPRLPNESRLCFERVQSCKPQIPKNVTGVGNKLNTTTTVCTVCTVYTVLPPRRLPYRDRLKSWSLSSIPVVPASGLFHSAHSRQFICCSRTLTVLRPLPPLSETYYILLQTSTNIQAKVRINSVAGRPANYRCRDVC